MLHKISNPNDEQLELRKLKRVISKIDLDDPRRDNNHKWMIDKNGRKINFNED